MAEDHNGSKLVRSFGRGIAHGDYEADDRGRTDAAEPVSTPQGHGSG